MSEEVDERPSLLRWGRVRLDVEPGVYGTVVLMTVLVVALDDGIDGYAEAAQLVLGPLLATALAHLFATVLAHVNRDGDPPTAVEFRGLALHAAQYLYLAVLPLLVVVAGAVRGNTPEHVVDVIIGLGLVLLIVLGGIGGRRAAGTWRAAALGALGAGVIGVLVLLLRVVLEH